MEQTVCHHMYKFHKLKYIILVLFISTLAFFPWINQIILIYFFTSLDSIYKTGFLQLSCQQI